MVLCRGQLPPAVCPPGYLRLNVPEAIVLRAEHERALLYMVISGDGRGLKSQPRKVVQMIGGLSPGLAAQSRNVAAIRTPMELIKSLKEGGARPRDDCKEAAPWQWP